MVINFPNIYFTVLFNFYRLEEITERLSGEATSLRPEFITPFKPLLKLVHNVPGYE